MNSCCVLFLLYIPLHVEFLLSSGIAAGLSGSIYIGSKLYCMKYECCNSKWLPYNVTNLKQILNEQVYGQPLLNEMSNIIINHVQSEIPPKPLVLSFHGPPGTGKNHVVNLITKVLFTNELNTKYRKIIIGSHEFYDHEKLLEYRTKLLDMISETVSMCEKRSLIIIDEADKLPIGLLDSLKPIMDFHQNVDGIDYRNTIFILMSNSGQEKIAEAALNYINNGYKLSQLTMFQTEKLLRSYLYNNNKGKNSGFYKASLIESSLVDYYFAFFPLEKSSVVKCIEYEANLKNITDIEKCVDDITSKLEFSPENFPLFSAHGCKKIYTYVDAYC